MAQAGIEADRERRKDDIVGIVLEIRAHALGSHDEVAVAEDDPLRLTGAARGVQDRGDVGVDPCRGDGTSSWGGAHELVPIEPARRSLRVDDHDLLE